MNSERGSSTESGDGDSSNVRVVCGKCGAKYSLPTARFDGRVLSIRCKACGTVFDVDPPLDTRSEDERSSGQQDIRCWFVLIGSERRGPIAVSEVIALRDAGSLSPESYVWRQGFVEWVRLGTVEELAGSTTGSDETHEMGHVDDPTIIMSFDASLSESDDFDNEPTRIVDRSASEPAKSPPSARIAAPEDENPRDAPGLFKTEYLPGTLQTEREDTVGKPEIPMHSAAFSTDASRRLLSEFLGTSESREDVSQPRLLRDERDENSVLFSLEELVAQNPAAARELALDPSMSQGPGDHQGAPKADDAVFRYSGAEVGDSVASGFAVPLSQLSPQHEKLRTGRLVGIAILGLIIGAGIVVAGLRFFSERGSDEKVLAKASGTNRKEKKKEIGASAGKKPGSTKASHRILTPRILTPPVAPAPSGRDDEPQATASERDEKVAITKQARRIRRPARKVSPSGSRKRRKARASRSRSPESEDDIAGGEWFESEIAGELSDRESAAKVTASDRALSVAAIERGMSRAKRDLQRCSKKYNQSGIVTVEAQINGRRGRVTRARILSTLFEKAFRKCVVRAITRRARFSRFRGEALTVTWPCVLR